jgi:pimeloyl-ACP methyl ester carboxylesterase
VFAAARRSAGAAFATIVIVSATGPASAEASAAIYEPAACPNPIVTGAPEFDLGPGFDCGYLIVPEDRIHFSGRTIRIPVARLKALSPTPKSDPIVFLAGGPGGSGLLEQSAVSGWNTDRDVIFISHRGTLKSDPFLSCPEIDEFTARSAGLVMADPATSAASAVATTTCRTQHAGQGWDLSDYNTTENAADVADLRIALGIDEWNVYGVSYGTNLALQLLRDRPAGIRTMVLDSVVTPQSRSIEVDWAAAAAGYRALFNACARQPLCYNAFPEVYAEFTSLVGDLTEEPRTVTVADPAPGKRVDVVVDGYKLANLVVRASNDPELRAEIPLIVHDLATAGGVRAAQALLPSSGPIGLFGYGLQLGVQCGEYVPRTNREQMRAVGKAALPDFPDAVLSLLPQTPYVFSDCAAWNVAPAGPCSSEPVRSDVPVLLISGAFDGIAPPDFAEAAASTLPNSRQLVFPGAGHAVFSSSPACFAIVMANFLDRPSDFDTSCLDAERVPAFVTS